MSGRSDFIQNRPEQHWRAGPALTETNLLWRFAMADRADITPALLRQLLDYNPDTGVLTWKPRPAFMFVDCKRKASHAAANWNSRYAHKLAFTANDAGYRCGRVFNHMFKAHRVAWAIHYGEWPIELIDHINGCRSDNRIVNLRVVGSTDNSRNMAISKRNTSGCLGVHWSERDSRWVSKISVDSREVLLGYFHSKEAAVTARKNSEIALGYHPNHGREQRID